jgi:hypothetical protein
VRSARDDGRLDSGEELLPEERDELLKRIQSFEPTAQHRVEDLSTQLARPEELAATLAERLTRTSAS